MRQLVRSSKNEKGFSLIEILVALLLMQLVLLVLLEVAVLIMNTNLRDTLRDFGVQVTQTEIAKYRSQRFEDIPTGTKTSVYQRKIGSAHYEFNVTSTVSDVPGNPDLKTLQVLTQWSFLRSDFSHTASQLIKQ